MAAMVQYLEALIPASIMIYWSATFLISRVVVSQILQLLPVSRGSECCDLLAGNSTFSAGEIEVFVFEK